MEFPGESYILDWLNDIPKPLPQPNNTNHPAKRRRVEYTQSRYPSPSLSSSDLPQSPSDTKLNQDQISHAMSGTPLKRSFNDVEQDTQYSDNGSDINETPRAKLQPRSLNRSRSSASSKASSSLASGASSPTKQVRYAATIDTGFEPFSFEAHLDRLPPKLIHLWESLNNVAHGTRILPRDLQQVVKGLGYFPATAFYDAVGDGSQWRLPSIDFVNIIFTRANECEKENEGESSWNNDVHSPLFNFVFRSSKASGLINYRYCTGAQIIHEYKPQGTPSKSVDYCLCIIPDTSSPEAKLLKHKADGTNRPELSINHTSWGNFPKNPIALSVETKRESDWKRAILQMGTWHSAQWRSLQWETHEDIGKIECLPGIIVEGHEWYFVASTLEDGRSKLYNKLLIGGTDSRFGIYKVVIALQILGQWIERVYWPSFRAVVLGIPDLSNPGFSS